MQDSVPFSLHKPQLRRALQNKLLCSVWPTGVSDCLITFGDQAAIKQGGPLLVRHSASTQTRTRTERPTQGLNVTTSSWMRSGSVGYRTLYSSSSSSRVVQNVPYLSSGGRVAVSR